MALKKKGLGRGLDALLSDNRIEDGGGEGGGVTMLRTADIEPNPNQARRVFDKGALEELAESIRLHGLLQPIAVTPKEGGFYEIIAGERRWRACKIAGVTEVPVIIKEVSAQNAAELSLIENLQRENLNPVEEARGYKALIEDFGLTQEAAADRVGKSRPAVANLLRILRLPMGVLSLVETGELSYGHVRALIPLSDKLSETELVAKAKGIAAAGLSVRETEKTVKAMLEAKPVISKKENPVENSYYKQLENRVSTSLGRRVAINRKAGKLTLSYSGSDDLENLIKALCGDGIFEEI